MPNILLINPPFECESEAVGTSQGFKEVLNIVLPLGLAYIAAILEKMGIQVSVADCSVGISYEELFKKILETSPDVIGLTATTPAFTHSKRVAQFVRDKLPQCKIILGGPHITADPQDAMESGLFDIGVIGEGERIIENLFNNYKNGQFENLENIKGVAYLKEGKLVLTPREEAIKDLDSIPFPARHLYPDLLNYTPTPASCRHIPYATVMTSRGCPSLCTFCDRAVFGERTHVRSVGNIMAELDHLVKNYGVKEVRFFDDTFTLNKKRIFALCEELRKRKYKLSWTCLTKVVCINKKLLQAMKKAGCWQVLYGLESADERMLKILGKRNTVEKNIEAIRLTREAGLEVRGDFIVGSPGETWESLEKTVQFTIDNKLNYAHFNKFTPFPGTKLYRDLVEQGYKFDFTKSSITEHNTLHYVNPGMDRTEFLEYLNNAHRRFYLRPGYILRRLAGIRSMHQLKGQVKGFFALLKF